MATLHPDLLHDRVIALAGEPRPALERELTALGARVTGLGPGEPRPNDLVYDAAAPFASGGLREAVDQAWDAIHAVATAHLIPSESGGAIVLIAPRPDAGPHATAARAALENTARTLSIEWARFAITTTAIAPGPATKDEEIATLVAYLVSPAATYVTGCRFDLGAVA